MAKTILRLGFVLTIMCMMSCSGERSTSNGTWGYVDRAGKLIIPAQFAEARGFSDGLAAVKVESSWGYIDRAGKLVIAAQFSEARNFANGLAAVKIKDTWGYIDRSGKVAIPAQFSEAREFAGGVAAVGVVGPGFGCGA